MSRMTVSRTEYVKLRRQAAAYRRMTARLFETVIKDPIHEVAEDFKNTDLYSKEFLKDLEEGLRRSSYAKR